MQMALQLAPLLIQLNLNEAIVLQSETVAQAFF